MSASKHYGIVEDITHAEPGSMTGNLSISSVLASSVHSPCSMIVVGSTSASPIELAQFVLTADQAIKLGALIVSAGQDALQADRDVERLRKHGPAAMRLCLTLAEADANDVLVDQSRVRLGFSAEAQSIAERAYSAVEYTDGDWRAAWRTAGERLRKEAGLP